MVTAREVVARLRQPSGGYFELRCSDFIAPSGCITCVIGKNGSGKSTLLRALGGIIDIDEGIITVANRHRKTRRERKECCSWLEASEVDQLVPFLSVNDHLRAVIEHTLSFSWKRRPVAEALSKSRLPNWLKELLDSIGYHRISDLSTGQRQSLRLGMCLLHHRPVILADESTANLDPINGRSIFGAFRAMVQEEQVTAVLVTHDLFLAAEFAGRIFLVSNGYVSQLPQEALSDREAAPKVLREALRATDDPYFVATAINRVAEESYSLPSKSPKN